MVTTRGLEELADSVVDERTREILRTINESYGPNSVQPITHLDEITTFKKDLGLGHGVVGIRRIQQELVDLGFLSANIAEYSADIQEKIIDNIFENISSTGLPSYYLINENPYAKNNRKVIAKSRQMKEYLSGLGITHLDDVNSTNAFKKGILRVLGSKTGNPRQMRQRLFYLGTFSSSIARYTQDLQDNIIDGIIGNISSTKPSYYLIDKNPYAKNNRKVIAESRQMKEYLLSIGIDNPDAATSTHAKGGLGTVLGSNQSLYQMKQRFAEFDTFPQNLEQYSPELQVKIIDNIFDIGTNHFESFFLAKYNKYADVNRRTVVNSFQMRRYLTGIGVENLGDIRKEHATKGLKHLIYGTSLAQGNIQDRLVELELFSSQTGKYLPTPI